MGGKVNARDNPEGWTTRQLVEFMHKDISGMKLAFDQVLRPFKAERKQARELLESMRGEKDRAHADIFNVMQLIARRHPEMFDDAVAVLVNPQKRISRAFLMSWRRRVGLKEGA